MSATKSEDAVALDALLAVGIEVESLDEVRVAVELQGKRLGPHQKKVRQEMRRHADAMQKAADALLAFREFVSLPSKEKWDQYEAVRVGLHLMASRINSDLDPQAETNARRDNRRHGRALDVPFGTRDFGSIRRHIK